MEEHVKVKEQEGRPIRNAHTDWQVWWRLLRPHTLTASIVPVLIGTVLAINYGSVQIPLFLAMLIATVLIQSATNMFNEYYDFKRGLDTEESVGIGGAIVRDGIHPKTILALAIVFFAAAIMLGFYICFQSSWWVAVIGLISMGAGYLYTGGPYPIAYTPFGELTSGFFMGVVLVLLSEYIHTGTVAAVSIWLSVPISILVAAILMSNNIRDLDGDRERGRKTLAILLGRERAIRFMGGMFITTYAWTAGMIILTTTSPWLLLTLLSIPKAVQAIRLFHGKQRPLEMMPGMKATAQLHGQYGLLFSVALFVEYVI